MNAKMNARRFTLTAFLFTLLVLVGVALAGVSDANDGDTGFAPPTEWVEWFAGISDANDGDTGFAAPTEWIVPA